MVTIFQKQKRKQLYLLILSAGIIIVTAFILLTDDKSEVSVDLPVFEKPIERVVIDFEKLDALQELPFNDFDKISRFDESLEKRNPFIRLGFSEFDELILEDLDLRSF